MGAKNLVIAGDYENKRFFIGRKGSGLIIGAFKSIPINKDTVAEYEVVDASLQTSAVSAVGRGLAGAFLLGPVGALAGLSAKKKGTHVVAIEFKDGKRSLLELDDRYYKQLMKDLF